MSSSEGQCLALREVYYDGAGVPAAHGEPFMCGASLEELRALLPQLALALARPVLSESDFVGQLEQS